MTEAIRAVIRAADAGQESELRQLIEESPELVDAKGDHDVTPLHAAAERDHLAAATVLLDAGAELEAETTWGMTPLQWAANMGSARVGRLLIERGARENLWSAAGMGRLAVVKQFLPSTGVVAAGATQKRHRQEPNGSWSLLPPSENDREPISDAFYIACRNGHVETAEYLLAMGADIEFRGFFGGTGLHWAALNGHADMVRFLLAHGADKSSRDAQFESTPQGWAVENHQEEVAALLK